MNSSRRRVGLAAFFVALLPAVSLLAVGVGSVDVPITVVADYILGRTINDVTYWTILHELRVPRVLLALLIGGGLAAAGAAYQGLFRNPLADPFVIGASAGAALGATTAIVLGASAAVSGMDPVAAAAFIGTFAAVAVVYGIGGIGTRSSPLTLLLAGAAVSTVLSAMVSLLVLVDDRSLQMVYYWMLGGLSGKGWSDVGIALVYMVPGVILVGLCARPLDAMALGDESARSLGLPLNRTRLLIIVAASLITAAAVAIGGIIGFVGLMAPHAARMIFGARHSVLIPASVLLGAILLVLADLGARLMLAPLEVPVGIITAVTGGPFFLYVLKSTGGSPGGRL